MNRPLILLILIMCSSGTTGAAQSLEQYLLRAARENPAIKASYSEFQAALEEVPQVRSLPDPQLTMTAFGSMVETRLGPQEARFSLMQMFPWFGTLEAREEVAAIMAEARFQDFLERRNAILYEVSQRYYELFALEKQLEFQEENLEIVSDLKSLALSQVRAGTGSLADVLQTEIRIDQNRTSLQVLELKRSSIAAALNLLLNRPSETPVIIDGEIDLEAITDTLSPEHNPEVEEMELMAAAYRARKEVARKEGYPSMGIGLDYVIIGERHDMVVDQSGRDAIMPMLSVSLPIFRKKNRAAQRQAGLMAASYLQETEARENELRANWEAAHFDMAEALKLLELYQKQIKNAEEVLQLLTSSYQNAGSRFREILEIRQDLLGYRFSKAAAMADYAEAKARLKYLNGNIFKDYDNKEQE